MVRSLIMALVYRCESLAHGFLMLGCNTARTGILQRYVGLQSLYLFFLCFEADSTYLGQGVLILTPGAFCTCAKRGRCRCVDEGEHTKIIRQKQSNRAYCSGIALPPNEGTRPEEQQVSKAIIKAGSATTQPPPSSPQARMSLNIMFVGRL